MTRLLDSILCPRGFETVYHYYKCIVGICLDCGLARFMWCPKELSSEILIPVNLFVNVKTTYKGKECKRNDLVKTFLKPRDLSSFFSISKKVHYAQLHFLWQANQFKTCIFDFSNDVVVSLVDFAKNYTFKEQNEIQSMHWWLVQVIIFVHITYY